MPVFNTSFCNIFCCSIYIYDIQFMLVFFSQFFHNFIRFINVFRNSPMQFWNLSRENLNKQIKFALLLTIIIFIILGYQGKNLTWLNLNVTKPINLQ